MKKSPSLNCLTPRNIHDTQRIMQSTSSAHKKGLPPVPKRFPVSQSAASANPSNLDGRIETEQTVRKSCGIKGQNHKTNSSCRNNSSKNGTNFKRSSSYDENITERQQEHKIQYRISNEKINNMNNNAIMDNISNNINTGSSNSRLQTEESYLFKNKNQKSIQLHFNEIYKQLGGVEEFPNAEIKSNGIFNQMSGMKNLQFMEEQTKRIAAETRIAELEQLVRILNVSLKESQEQLQQTRIMELKSNLLDEREQHVEAREQSLEKQEASLQQLTADLKTQAKQVLHDSQHWSQAIKEMQLQQKQIQENDVIIQQKLRELTQREANIQAKEAQLDSKEIQLLNKETELTAMSSEINRQETFWEERRENLQLTENRLISSFLAQQQYPNGVNISRDSQLSPIASKLVSNSNILGAESQLDISPSKKAKAMKSIDRPIALADYNKLKSVQTSFQSSIASKQAQQSQLELRESQFIRNLDLATNGKKNINPDGNFSNTRSLSNDLSCNSSQPNKLNNQNNLQTTSRSSNNFKKFKKSNDQQSKSVNYDTDSNNGGSSPLKKSQKVFPIVSLKFKSTSLQEDNKKTNNIGNISERSNQTTTNEYAGKSLEQLQKQKQMQTNMQQSSSLGNFTLNNRLNSQEDQRNNLFGFQNQQQQQQQYPQNVNRNGSFSLNDSAKLEENFNSFQLTKTKDGGQLNIPNPYNQTNENCNNKTETGFYEYLRDSTEKQFQTFQHEGYGIQLKEEHNKSLPISLDDRVQSQIPKEVVLDDNLLSNRDAYFFNSPDIELQNKRMQEQDESNSAFYGCAIGGNTGSSSKLSAHWNDHRNNTSKCNNKIQEKS